MTTLVPINKLNGLDWTAADLQKKFQDAWVEAKLLNNKKEPIYRGPVYVAGVEISPGHAQVKFFPSNSQGMVQNFTYSNILIGDDRPDPCITNYLHNAVMFNYNPARQWRRGFGPHNCFLFSGSGSPSLTTVWCSDLARKVLNPEHTPLLLALEWFKVNPTGASRALDNHYWLIKSNEALKLYRRKAFVGTFIGKKFFIKGEAEIFREELRKELPDLREASYV